MPRRASLMEFLNAAQVQRERVARGDTRPCCTDDSCPLCRAAGEEDAHEAERDARRMEDR